MLLTKGDIYKFKANSEVRKCSIHCGAILNIHKLLKFSNLTSLSISFRALQRNVCIDSAKCRSIVDFLNRNQNLICLELKMQPDIPTLDESSDGLPILPLPNLKTLRVPRRSLLNSTTLCDIILFSTLRCTNITQRQVDIEASNAWECFNCLESLETDVDTLGYVPVNVKERLKHLKIDSFINTGTIKRMVTLTLPQFVNIISLTLALPELRVKTGVNWRELLSRFIHLRHLDLTFDGSSFKPTEWVSVTPVVCFTA
jgi:hypothetical protein